MNYALIFILASFAGAISGAFCTLILVRRVLRRFSIRPSAQLSNEVTQLRSDLDSISVTVKRLHAKYGMRAVRGQRAEAQASSFERRDGESIADWKARAREQLGGRFAQ